MLNDEKRNSPNRHYRSLSQVTIYCDETTIGNRANNGWGIFIVPNRLVLQCRGRQSLELNPQRELLKAISDVRKSGKFDRKFHFTEISGRSARPKDDVLIRYLSLAARFLTPISLSGFDSHKGCKVTTTAYNNCSRTDLYDGGRKESKVKYHESLLRNLIKSALHYFYNDDNQVLVQKVVCDMSPFHRDISAERTIHRLWDSDFYGSSSLGKWVRINRNCELIHLNSDHRVHDEGTGSRAHAEVLQMTDMVIGSVNYVHATPEKKENLKRRDRVTTPIRDLMDSTDSAFPQAHRWRSVSTVSHSGKERWFENPPRKKQNSRSPRKSKEQISRK
jgi:hypothetical protein